jgi:hypothetical protein
MQRRMALALLVVSAFLFGCKDPAKVSMEQAKSHVTFLSETISKDVEEVRHGLPPGADALAESFKAQPALDTDLKAVRDALDGARRKVQDLRVAKSTFFAVADVSGAVLRNDQEQDRMAGKSLFAAFPALTAAKDGYVETTGSMPEAAGVRAPRPDGQWIAGSPVRVNGATRAIYVSGWSWASYAYRLEFALRSKIRSELREKREENEPLVYVFIVVGKAAYGAPVTPEVSAQSVAGLDPLGKAKGEETFAEKLELTGRAYGLAVRRAPALGPDVGIAVLRSET